MTEIKYYNTFPHNFFVIFSSHQKLFSVYKKGDRHLKYLRGIINYIKKEKKSLNWNIKTEDYNNHVLLQKKICTAMIRELQGNMSYRKQTDVEKEKER